LDWAWFFYAGTVLLKLSENEFWRLTPRKLILLLNQHTKYQQLLWSPITGYNPSEGAESDQEYNTKEFNKLM